MAAGWGASTPLAVHLGGVPAFVPHRDIRTLLSDEATVAAYASFQKAMIPFASANAAEVRALSNPAGGWRHHDHQLPREIVNGREPAAVSFRRHKAAALASARLSPMEATLLSGALGGYLDALRAARACGDASRLDAARDEVRERYGDAALQAAMRNEAALGEAASALPAIALGR